MRGRSGRKGRWGRRKKNRRGRGGNIKEERGQGGKKERFDPNETEKEMSGKAAYLRGWWSARGRFFGKH